MMDLSGLGRLLAQTLVIWSHSFEPRSVAESAMRIPNVCLLGLCLSAAIAISACSGARPTMPKKFVDLSPTIGPGLVERQFGPMIAGVGYLPEPSFEHMVEEGEGFYSAMSVVTMLNHLGAHADPPRHISKTGRSIDEMPLDRFFGEVVFFDFRDRSRNTPLMPHDFQSRVIGPDSVVLAYVGYQAPTTAEALPMYPYLSGEAAEYLVTMGIKAFGTDMPGLMSIANSATAPPEDAPHGDPFPEHTALLEKEIAVIEGLSNLEALIDEPRVIFVGFPIKLEEGTGAPLRAVGLVY